MSGCVKRYFCPNKPIKTSGCRSTFYYPNGGSYSGYWLNNKNHGWGVKVTAERQSSDFAGKKEPDGQLIYKGLWNHGKRDGCGSMIRKRGTDLQTIYTGKWMDDMKHGMGKHFYPDGCVYFGEWERNRRHGLGIQWHADGSIYLGEWETGFKHGLGVLFYANGYRYEGHFARGFKNGEGVFYHMHTGQIQKGMWQNDNARVSLMQDAPQIRRNDAVTPLPIPRNCLRYPNQIIRDLFKRFRPHGDKPHRRFNDMVSLEFIHRQRQFASFEERFSSPSGIDIYPNSGFVCTCDCKVY
ncbi:MORN repeat-containing protein 3 [Drosophila nasuta]|uniref:MORN repeat-containing protein 3 n=1 Tax=Drosophila nasuta TaxID=42062 RepID=UPI00295F5857|nr:MORN repeat-containing protein 3 [Drosophila nasuta]